MDQQRKEIHVNGDHMTFCGAKMSNGQHYEWGFAYSMICFLSSISVPTQVSMLSGVRYVIRNAVL